MEAIKIGVGKNCIYTPAKIKIFCMRYVHVILTIVKSNSKVILTHILYCILYIVD